MSKSTKVHTRYYLKDGKTQVAGVTTILGILDKPALVPWAWNLGLKGEDYRKIRDKAGSIGSIAHERIEHHLKKQEMDLSEYSQADIDKANNSFNGFLEFEKTHKLELLKSEISLVSETHRFGGTIDLYAMLDGKKSLIDFKTSKGIWVEHRIQVAAYKNLLIENGYDVEEVYLLHINKENGEFTVYYLKDLDLEWKFFKGLCAIYPLKKVLWKR